MTSATAALRSPTLSLRGRTFTWGERTIVVGILNVTPDSFSGDGIADGPAAALQRARSAVAAGADLLDVGGESTRPGAEPVSADEEMDRVVPTVAAIRAALDVPISVDTSKAAVADAALAAGADLVNDVWGLRADPEMAALVARRRVPVILMHNRSNAALARLAPRVGGHYAGVDYADLVGDVRRELGDAIALALAAGIEDEQIIVDPGIGFGKTPAQNLELLDRTAEIRSLGYPVLVGTSRKSFIGQVLDAPPGERLEGTSATVAVAITRGADLVRVHDVAEMARVARMTDAIVRRPAGSPLRGR